MVNSGDGNLQEFELDGGEVLIVEVPDGQDLELIIEATADSDEDTIIEVEIEST